MPDETIKTSPGRTATPATPATGPTATNVAYSIRPRSELERMARYAAGVVVLVALGWGLVFSTYFLLHSVVAGAVAAAVSLGLFLLLERDFRFSRFMGLRTGQHWTPVLSAASLWLFNVAGLFVFRSPEPAASTSPQEKPLEVQSSTREIIETIVFVVVLVLLLKSFVAEAFVIPTGSMAETLYGYQKEVTCPQCGYKFPVNCSSEVEPKPPRPVESCTCPNCRLDIRFERGKIDPSCDTGDRVLVAKFVYDTGLFDVEPFDVVVFKFPEEPQRDYVPMNYIKRLIGKPTQTVGIYYGDLYISEGLAYDASLVVDPSLPERRRIFKNAKRDLLENWDLDKGPSPFKIMRKPPDKSLAMRRIVYDNDHPAKDLQKESFPPRWSPERDEAGVSPADFVRKRQLAEQERSWVAQEPHGFRHAARQGQRAWLRYRHLLVSRGREFEALPNVRPDSVKPQLITDFMGYNSGRPEDLSPPMNWVGDLLLECKVTVEQAEGEFAMELSKGADRFQAVWQLPSGQCQLIRLQEGQPPKVLESRETALKKPGSYRVRFANVDQRLTVWVDGALPFGEGVNYEPPTERRGSAFRVAHGPSEKNDLEPASIGVQGAGLSVGELKLWRDTYYTVEDTPNHPDSIWAQPSEWDRLRDLKALTLYVQPNHYLCLGDNSPRSSDSRSWGRQSRLDDAIGGLVPERLMLGRALLIYWPFDRFGPIK